MADDNRDPGGRQSIMMPRVDSRVDIAVRQNWTTALYPQRRRLRHCPQCRSRVAPQSTGWVSSRRCRWR